MVRHTLGEDAVIVATREEPGGGAVRVTAAVEPQDQYESDDTFVAESYEPQRNAPHFELETVPEPASANDWLQYDDEDEEAAVIEQLTDTMLRHSVADEITDQVISCATVIGMDRADMALIAALEHLYSFRPLPKKPTTTALMMIGPPGSGKTLAVAKLAARAVMDGLRVSVITTDTVRAGGVEQLAAFTKLLRINLQKASNPKQLRQCLDASRNADQIIIDTAAVNPFDTEQMRILARMIATGDIEPVLTLPGGIDADESGEIARIYAALGVRSLLPTRLDITRRLGGLLGAAHHGGLIFADASNTQKVADGLIQLSPKTLTHLLMPQASRSSRTVKKPPQKKRVRA